MSLPGPDDMRLMHEAKMAADTDLWNARAEAEFRYLNDAVFHAKVKRGVSAAIQAYDRRADDEQYRAMLDAALFAVFLVERD